MLKSNDPRLRLLANAPPLKPEPEPVATLPVLTGWTLTKKGHTVICTIHAHPLGVELRLDLDGELHRSEVIRCAAPARPLPAHVVDVIVGWRDKWIAKGWRE
jgi:hypothetical protein